MKLAVLGAGTQARAIVDDFLRFSGAEEIGVADGQAGLLKDFVGRFDDPRLRPKLLEAADARAVTEWLEPYDAVISAVPYRFNLGLAEAAVRAKTHFTDLGGNNDIVAQELALDEKAKAAGVLLVPDLGLAPGMVGLLGADLVRRLGAPRRLDLRVGGLPVEPKPPLNYRLFFSVSGLINEYIEPCRVIRKGKKQVVPGLSELEALAFSEPFGELEAFQTSGGTSTLVDSLFGEVEELSYKTIRYPGHHRELRLLQDLGLFEQEPIDVAGNPIVPRMFTEALLQNRLGDRVSDVILMRITASGTLDGKPTTSSEELVEYADEERGLSAMARCTGYPAAIITTLIASGEIEARGAQPQEACVPAQRFRECLKERGLALREKQN